MKATGKVHNGALNGPSSPGTQGRDQSSLLRVGLGASFSVSPPETLTRRL